MGYIDGNRESHAYNVTFRSLSEDKPHPDAGSPLVKALDNQIHPQLFDSPYTQSMIFGDYYGLLCKYAHKADDELVDLLQIWNWKSKEASPVSQSPLFCYDLRPTWIFSASKRLTQIAERRISVF